MNKPLSIEQLKRIKGIMQSMLAEASNANWQELSRLDSERRVTIDYQEEASGKNKAFCEASAGGQPHPVQHQESEGTAPEVLRGTLTAPLQSSAETVPNPEYRELTAELAALDKQIITTVLNARQSLLEQTRGLQAQVSAKKGYEQASTMKVYSYS